MTESDESPALDGPDGLSAATSRSGSPTGTAVLSVTASAPASRAARPQGTAAQTIHHDDVARSNRFADHVHRRQRGGRDRGRGRRSRPFHFLGDGRVERRAVAAGAQRDGDRLVTSGLAPGERVVVEGPSDLAEGVAVKEK